MRTDTLREDDIEEPSFDAPLFAQSGATNTIIESEPSLDFWRRGHADVICRGPYGRFLAALEAKGSKESVELGAGWQHAHFFLARDPNSYRRARELLQSAVVLYRSSIDELSRKSELWESLSASYASLPEEAKFTPLEAIHPVTKFAYQQLDATPTTTRASIQDILKQLARIVPYILALTLPRLRLAVLEDSSYLLEWTFKDRRLGFLFERDPKDSGWYYVYSSGSSERYESGTMDQLDMSRLVKMALKP